MGSAACGRSTRSRPRPPWAYTKQTQPRMNTDETRIRRFPALSVFHPCSSVAHSSRRTAVIHIPVLRWGEPYKSLEVDKVVHFDTGEVLAEVSRANAALVERDMRHAQRARDVLRQISIA